VSDEARLRRALTEEVFKGDKGAILEGTRVEPRSAERVHRYLCRWYVLLGKTENMRAGLEALRRNAAGDKKDFQQSAEQSSAPIVTYANDEARVNNFISTLLMLQVGSSRNEEVAKLQESLRRAGFASTETRLNAFGIERTTRSAFGQFSTFIGLLQPEGNR
jgi:hypothetical protein